MRRDFSESAPPIALPASRTRSPEASMGHLPGNPAEEPNSARSGGHLPGKSPWADVGEHFATALAGAGALSGRAHEGFPGGFRRQRRGQGVGGADPGLRRAKRVRPGLGSPDGPRSGHERELLPTTPAGCGIARALGHTTGGGIARAPGLATGGDFTRAPSQAPSTESTRFLALPGYCRYYFPVIPLE